MYQSTIQFGELIQQDSRTFHAMLTVDEKTNITTGIRSVKIIGGSNSEDDFSIGSAISQYIELELYKPEIPLEGHEICLKIGLEVDGNMEYVPMGYFTAEKPQADENYITVTAYDRMMKTERPCFLELPSTTTTIAVLNAISAITGVTVVVSGLSTISMQRPDGYTCREVLSFIAQMYGGFVICNRQGKIEIRWFEDKYYVVPTGRYWDSFTHNDYSFTLDKLTCYTGKDDEGNDMSISVGFGTREINFSNPMMTQTMLNNVWKKLQNYAYMPGNLSFLGDPRIDPWDILTIEDRMGNSYKVPVMKLVQTFDGGLTTEAEAVGKSETEQESGFKGPSTKNQERWSIQLALINHAMINKLDVDTANITYATIQNLNVVNQYVHNLDAEFGNFKNLTVTNLNAANAKISILEVDNANIKSLLAGNAGIGDLQSIHLTAANAVIDSALIRTAVMQTVTINDLLAGTISTDKFNILSDDGGLKIQGATAQWLDESGNVRVQIGKDATGDFTFALMNKSGSGVLIDSEVGVHKGAIADGLIVNSMVADDAAIGAGKLDINSLFEEINGSTNIIKSNRIYLDERNQTLNVAFSQLSTNLTSTSNRVTNIEAGIDGLKLNISDMETGLKDVTKNDLLYNISYADNGNGTTTLTAAVYRSGKEVTKEFPERWFTWRKKSEDQGQNVTFGVKRGYSITVKNEEAGLGGCVIVGRFTTRDTYYLTNKAGRRITTRTGRRVTIDKEE